MNTFYTTALINSEGNLVYENGLYCKGLEHAKNCCLDRLKENDKTVRGIILIPDDGGKNILIKNPDQE